MRLAAVLKLLPPPEMARGMQHAAACEVQGRLLAEMGQRSDRILAWSFARMRMHTPLGDSYRARRSPGLRGAYCCIARRFHAGKWAVETWKAVASKKNASSG